MSTIQQDPLQDGSMDNELEYARLAAAIKDPNTSREDRKKLCRLLGPAGINHYDLEEYQEESNLEIARRIAVTPDGPLEKVADFLQMAIAFAKTREEQLEFHKLMLQFDATFYKDGEPLDNI